MEPQDHKDYTRSRHAPTSLQYANSDAIPDYVLNSRVKKGQDKIDYISPQEKKNVQDITSQRKQRLVAIETHVAP